MKKILASALLLSCFSVNAAVTKYVCEQYGVEQLDGVIIQHKFIKLANIYDNGKVFSNELGNKSPALENMQGGVKGYFFFYREPLNYAITDKDTGSGNTFENCREVK